MKLKKIKISGFKSFADRVVLDFHEGITIVVGPNGCGKSNIADAFRWVMGEQSVKSMRGGKMQDIIFAGSSLRKPLGMAEVSLTFSNDEGRVGVPYREVEITRRYHRDGESEYLINGNPVRLKDVQSILIDVGIGKNAYAIIEQGKIDQIIQLGPNERRIIFEEAAGILKFLINKRETERKLQEVELNCARLKDIQDEVQKEINHLSGQAKRAEEYKGLKAKGELAERNYLSLKIEDLEGKREKELQKVEALKGSLSKGEEALQGWRKELREARESLDEDARLLRDKEKTLYELKTSIEVKEKELETIKERLEEGKAQGERLKKDKETLYAERALREKDKQEGLSRQKTLSKALEKETALLKEKEAGLLDVEKRVLEKRRDLEAMQERLLSLTRNSHMVSSEMKQKSVRYEALMEKVSGAEKESERLNGELKKASKECEEKQEALKIASEEVDIAKAAFEVLEKQLQAGRQELEEVQKLYETFTEELFGLRAREKALLKLREEMEGAQEGTKALMKVAKLKGKLKGLWEYFEIEPGFEAAVDSVLRPYSDTLVASSEEAFNEALAFAEQKKLSGFSLVLIPEKEGKALKDSLYHKVKKHPVAYHFLKDKYLHKKWEDVSEDKEAYTLDGYFKDRYGVLFSPTGKGGSLFLREAELKGLQEKLKTLEKESSELKTRLEALQTQRKMLTEERLEKDKQLRAKEMGLVDKNYQLQRVKGEEERLKKALENVSQVRESGLKEQKGLEEELAHLEEKNRSEEGVLKAFSEEKASLVKALQDEEEAFRLESGKFKEEKQAFYVKSDETRKILYALNLIEVKDQESRAEERKLDEEAARLKEQTVLLEAKRADILSLSRDHGGDLSDLEAKRVAFEEALKGKKEAVSQKEARIQKKDQELKEESQKLQASEVRLAEIAAKWETFSAEFRDKWPELKPQAPKLDLSEVESEMKRIKKALEGYQDVNLAATETLDQHKARARDLDKEITDLLNSSDELKVIINDLSSKSATLFRDTFEAVRSNFKKNFQILFQGGEADLELTESDDMLKAGIEIVAKPPGKQMRSINLLSGGEKCLTAMALLFSLFEVKAAPFCLLDEIDAPLDDTNVGRFSDMVKHFVDRSQFIIITHNKRTMSMGDRLFGVSMEEKGVSKLLRVEFEKESKPKEVQLV